jgi:hypothetical protein
MGMKHTQIKNSHINIRTIQTIQQGIGNQKSNGPAPPPLLQPPLVFE